MLLVAGPENMVSYCIVNSNANTASRLNQIEDLSTHMSDKIGILGGTGPLGKGLALRWAVKHYKVIIGSRNFDRAKQAAVQYMAELKTRGFSDSYIEYGTNKEIIENADILVLAIPYESLKEVLSIQPPATCIVISPVVPLKKNRTFKSMSPSAVEIISNAWPNTRIVAAGHTLSAARLCALELPLNQTCFIASSDNQAKEVAHRLFEAIEGIHPAYCGPLEVAGQIEQLTPLLLNLAKYSKVKDPGLLVV